MTVVSDKERVIVNLQKQISRLMHQKGETTTTLEDFERSKLSPRKPISALELEKEEVTPYDPYRKPNNTSKKEASECASK